MNTYIVWLDHKDKWHCWEESWGKHTLIDEKTRKTARLMVHGKRGQEGTADWLGQAKASFAIHARSRYQAIKMAKGYYKRKQLK